MEDFFSKYFNVSLKSKRIDAKEILLNTGEVSNYMFYIKKGCLRTWFLIDGKELTFQFFFENQLVSSFESFCTNQTSLYTIESIEPTEIQIVTKEDFRQTLDKNPSLKADFNDYVIQRLFYYQKLFVSRISEKPETRYLRLIKNQPEILKRIPQHYIASYLGITPVSLSRIRNRIIH